MENIRIKNNHKSDKSKIFFRVKILYFFMIFFFLAITVKLFSLQILNYDYYVSEARKAHWKKDTIKSDRGEILIEDVGNDFAKLATNEELCVITVNPNEAEKKDIMADFLAEIIFDEACIDVNARAESRLCVKDKKDNLLEKKEQTDIEKEIEVENYENKKKEFRDNIFDELSQEYFTGSLIIDNLDAKTTEEAKNLGIKYINVEDGKIFVDSLKITSESKDRVMSDLVPILPIPSKYNDDINDFRDYIKNQMKVRKKKSSKIVDKLSKQACEKIDEIIFIPKKNRKSKQEIASPNLKGISIKNKNYRVYIEGPLMAQIIGFINNDGEAQYGIEETFDSILTGKEGIISGEKDILKRPIRNVEVEISKQGKDVVLTIDRIVQFEMEKIIKKATEDYQAYSGEIIVMDPFTGQVIAMAQYPSFDPNNFGEVYKKKLATKDFVEKKRRKWVDFPHEKNKETNQIFIYENIYSSGVFKSFSLANVYEPGSVFKVITMAAAIDAGEVYQNSIFNDTGPIEVKIDGGIHKIKNATGKYYGEGTTMTEVLQYSLNTGISFVARKLGRELFYSYINNFGFGKYTNIEYSGEVKGKVKRYSEWSEIELYTYGFGQGFFATPMQVITAVSAIANGGNLMQATLVKGFRDYNGVYKKNDSVILRKVLKEETANKVAEMMQVAVEDGVADGAKIEGRSIAGKTGTTQTYRYGKVLSGPGTTIATFVGFSPVKKPKFIVLVKLDRAETSEWASKTAAPVFKKVAEFLFEYYNLKN